MDHNQRSGVTPAPSRSSSALVSPRHAKPKKTEAFCFGSKNGSRHDACQPVNPRDPGKHPRFCNPERRGVALIARLAAA
jgi:hypothetical protein